MSLIPAKDFHPPDIGPDMPVHGNPQADTDAKLFFSDILAAFHRNWKSALVAGMVTAGLVLVGAMLLTPLYKSTATVMLETRQEQVVDLEAVLSNLPSNTFVIDSEVQVLQSDSLARRVVDRLQLAHDPEFNGTLRDKSPFNKLKSSIASAYSVFIADYSLPSDPTVQRNAEAGVEKGYFSRLSSAIGSATGALISGLAGDNPLKRSVDARTMQSVLQTFKSHLEIDRVGLTYAISISFSSMDPEKAVRIANAVAGTYVGDQKAVKEKATSQATDFLEGRVTELEKEVQEADEAVAQYKSQHGLLNAVGSPLVEQEISALGTQLATAQAEQAEQEGKLAATLSQSQSGGLESIGQAATSGTLGSLRAQQAEVLRDEADIKRRYGTKHPAYLKIEQERAALDSAIHAETARIVSNQEAETAAARQRTSSLQASISRNKQVLAQNNSANVQLSKLQRNADAVRSLYESFLSRLKQTEAQQGLQRPDAQIISQANVPLGPSFPPWRLVYAGAATVFVFFAAATVALREFFDRGLRSPEDAEFAVGLPVLAAIPWVSDGDPGTYALKQPLSAFAEAIRGLRTSLFLSRIGTPPKVVAFMSAVPGEGKTVTTLAVARQVAASGARVAIVDADLRRCTLSSVLPHRMHNGLVEFMLNKASLESCLHPDPASSAMILPVANGGTSYKDLFFTCDLERAFDALRKRFDVIFIDAAPLLPLAEPRIVASYADAVVLLSRWHKTSRAAIQEAAKLIRTVNVPVAGMALTCVDLKRMASFGYSTRRYGYRRTYGAYYVE